MARSTKDLLGKMIYCQLDGKIRKRGAIGQRLARVVSVKETRQRLSTVTVRLFNPCTARYDGRKVSLTSREWNHPRITTGIVWFGRVRPIPDWLNDRVPPASPPGASAGPPNTKCRTTK